jgi:hypothetical protein
MPGDVVARASRGRARLYEIAEIVDADARAVKARAIDPEIFAVPARPPRPAVVAVPAAAGPPAALVLDLPALNDESDPPLQHFAIHAAPWPGANAVWRASGGSYERIALATVPAVIGELLEPLRPGPAHVWDRANSFRVRLAGGALASAAEEAVLNGANAAAVRNASGAWEVLQFAQAELVDTQSYRLSQLLRGQLGSERTMSAAHGIGAPFVLLDLSLVAVARGVDLLGRAFSWRVGAATEDVGSADMTAFDATVGATALLPWSPAHLRGARVAEGVQLAWTRRTRMGGDGWDALDVPLNEATEAYRVEILDGGDVVRTIESAAAEALYANADELADFGAPQSSLTVRVAQLSALVGAGTARTATLSL